ncbi:MAG: hypothetical protein ACUVUC_15635 [Thermoguttaceae bacterium]
MNPEFDPYREALVVERLTVWPQQFAGLPDDQRQRIESLLHADPASASQLHYVRLPSGFCRKITVTPEDLQRLHQPGG